MREAPGEEAQRSGFVSCKYACRRLKKHTQLILSSSYQVIRCRLDPTSFSAILGDPGAVSGGGKKSKRARNKFGRRKVKNAILRPNFFLAHLDFFPPPLTAPGSPRMVFRLTACDLVIQQKLPSARIPVYRQTWLDSRRSFKIVRSSNRFDINKGIQRDHPYHG